MHHHSELSFVDECRWVSPLHYLANGWQNAVLLWCMLQAGPPSLHYYCAVVLHSCIALPPVGRSSIHEYHCCQLARYSSCVSNFYRTFKIFIWLSLVVQNKSEIQGHVLCQRNAVNWIYQRPHTSPQVTSNYASAVYCKINYLKHRPNVNITAI